jgi:hypothetical protein
MSYSPGETEESHKKNSVRKPVILGTIHNRVTLVNAYIKL